MRLLFDQNLSWRLRVALAEVFPDSLHVRDVDLATADDAVVWDFARLNDLPARDVVIAASYLSRYAEYQNAPTVS